MSKNIFLEKFKHKTDSELEHILSNKKTYTEEARSAAINLLEKRNVTSSELEKAQKEIDIKKDKKIVGVNKTIGLIFHSQKSIGIASFFGGPLAAGYLIRENYLALNKPDEAKKSLLIGIISTIIIFYVLFMIPESIIDKIPNQLFPLIYTAIILFIVAKVQGTILSQHKEHNNEFFSGWRAAGIGLISSAIMIIGIFGFVYLTPDSTDIYNEELTRFSTNEEETIVFYDHLDSENMYSLVQELDDFVLPKWKENVEIIKSTNQIENLPTELLKQNEILLKYSELRIEAFELFKKAITEDTDKYYLEIEQIHLKIDEQLKKLN